MFFFRTRITSDISQRWHGAVRTEEGGYTGLRLPHSLYPWAGMGALECRCVRKSSINSSHCPMMRPFFHPVSVFATGIKMEQQRFEATGEGKPVDN